MVVDQYGRVIYSEEDLINALMIGDDITGLFSHDTERYNALCIENDKRECIIDLPPDIPETPLDYHAKRQAEWLFPKEYMDIDIWSTLEGRCSTFDEKQRLEEEKKLYQKYNLEPVLRLMIYMVDSFRSRNIVWGVGRGSSVASFALYLIGITKINPMKYGLEISEFLKD